MNPRRGPFVGAQPMRVVPLRLAPAPVVRLRGSWNAAHASADVRRRGGAARWILVHVSWVRVPGCPARRGGPDVRRVQQNAARPPGERARL